MKVFVIRKCQPAQPHVRLTLSDQHPFLEGTSSPLPALTPFSAGSHNLSGPPSKRALFLRAFRHPPSPSSGVRSPYTLSVCELFSLLKVGVQVGNLGFHGCLLVCMNKRKKK